MDHRPRLHVEPDAPLAAGAKPEMGEREAHYLGRVLRLGAGDAVRLFNARDGEWMAWIDSLPRHGRGRLRVSGQIRPPTEEAGPILLFAPVKRDATDLIVRMATELGVRAIWPVLTGRTNTARVRVERLDAIATEAAEQCERLSVPLMAEPRSFAAMLSQWPPERVLCAAIERTQVSTTQPRSRLADGVLIGPEGGFTRPELDALHGRAFVTPISLGPRILRAETAVVAALACLQAARERWGLIDNLLPSGGGEHPHPRATPAEPDVEPR